MAIAIKQVANSLLKYAINHKGYLVAGLGAGAGVYAVKEIKSNSKQKQQHEKEMLYKQALMKLSAKCETVRDENARIKSLLNDVISSNGVVYE